MPPDPLAPATVRDLARLAGLPLDEDDALAARIAGGASSAIAAVAASVGETLFDLEPGDYLGALERLAEPPEGGAK
ncbi:MAG: hypothetical protein U1F18_03735 [Steroidobacteraceae bacterium]